MGMRRLGLAVAGIVALLGFARHAPATDFPEVFTVEAQDTAVPVGHKGVLVAYVHLREGYEVLDPYNNRLIKLSAWDEAVTFDREVYKPDIEGTDMKFTIGITPTKAGKHAINGLFRLGYFKDDTFTMVNVPLIASVTGTE